MGKVLKISRQTYYYQEKSIEDESELEELIQVEFVHQYHFETLAHLRLELFDYVHWWNSIRLHGTLRHETPINYRQQRSAKHPLDNELACDTDGEAA